MQRLYKCLVILFCLTVTLSQADNFTYIKQQANQGNAIAQYVLGMMYQQGKGASANKATAITWYTKSAKQNYLLAQYALIAMYQYGDGIKPAPDKVRYWYQQTSSPRSVTLLNKQQQNTAQVISFLQTLATRNNTDAQYLLATLYASEKQDTMANYWFLRGAMVGDKDAQYYIGLVYQDKQGAFNKLQGIYWLEKAAQQNFLDAEVVLASIYEQGGELAPNYTKAAYWYEQAANQGDVKAQSFIAGMYRDGKGVATDKQKALMWYEKAANQGDAFSQYNLGQMYETASGEVTQDINKAIYWYQKGADQGHTASQLRLKVLQGK